MGCRRVLPCHDSKEASAACAGIIRTGRFRAVRPAIRDGVTVPVQLKDIIRFIGNRQIRKSHSSAAAILNPYRLPPVLAAIAVLTLRIHKEADIKRSVRRRGIHQISIIVIF